MIGVYSPGLLPGQLGWALGSLIWWVQPAHSRGDFVVPSNPTRSVRRGSPVEPSIPKGRTDCHTILPFKHSLRTTTTNQKLPLKAESKFFTERNVHFAFCAVFTFSGKSEEKSHKKQKVQPKKGVFFCLFFTFFDSSEPHISKHNCF